MTAPFSVDIAADVSPDRIDPDVTILGPASISGAKTVLSAGVRLGAEGPVTLTDCRLGRNVELRGGFFSGSVFLKGASMGSGAQVRPGCLLEESASGNHSVGLKQTILFPFVTLGSLVNFCDCLMAGGTSRKNHSEVGSSYIHFNYTPQQDKATASLIGDVPRGVMLREAPIFLGGQGGLVGPARIAYGSLIPAGVICRVDCLKENMCWSFPARRNRTMEFIPGRYGDVARKIANNFLYIANLLVLKQWYFLVRRSFFSGDTLSEALYLGALRVIEGAVDERIRQMDGFADRLAQDLCGDKNRLAPDVWRTRERFLQKWPDVAHYLRGQKDELSASASLDKLAGRMQFLAGRGMTYLEAIANLTATDVQTGTDGLHKIVADITKKCAVFVADARCKRLLK